jgi:hypothetical protein
MQNPIQALAWQFWSVHRRGWLLVLLALPLCAIVSRIFAVWYHGSEVLGTLTVMSMVFSLIFVIAFCDFTDQNSRGGFAGFPQRLFTAPVRTSVLVLCPMSCAIAALAGLFIAWSLLVIRPLGMKIDIVWPAAVLACTMVTYQTIIWCLSGFRIIRIVVMSLSACVIVTIFALPMLLANVTGRTPPDLEFLLLPFIAAFCAAGYCASVITVGMQRRGGGRGLRRSIIDLLSDAIARRPVRSRTPIASPLRALLWMEWRRNGGVLPAAILLMILLIIGPVSWINDHDAVTTAWTALCIFLMPLILAIFIGKGVARPDFWSLERSIPSFLSTRPVTAGDIVGVKIKCATFSVLTAWAIVFLVAPLWIRSTGNPDTLDHIVQFLHQLYSPTKMNVLATLIVLSAILLTWSFMIGSIWLGMWGRQDVFYTVVGISFVLIILAGILVGGIVSDDNWQRFFVVHILPLISWLLAGWMALKFAAATWVAAKLRRRNLISDWGIAKYLVAWSLTTGVLIALACIASPQIIWLRNDLILVALTLIPLTRVALAPLAVAHNRFR